MSYKRQKLLTPREHLSSPPVFLVRSVLLIFLVFCIVLLCVFTFWVSCCDVHYDIHINTVFGSSLPLVVYRMAHVLYVCLCIVVSNTYSVVFLRLVYLMLSVSLDCPSWIAPSVLSNVYLKRLTYDVKPNFVWISAILSGNIVHQAYSRWFPDMTSLIFT